MDPIKLIRSRTVVMPSSNIDTDQIIPARFLTTTVRVGLGKSLFADWRYDANGNPRPDFVLNQPAAKGCEVLVAGRNLGCGSSREHAPWALLDFGIRCVISTSFADIFYNNCFQNGLLPVVLKADEVQALMEEAKGGNHLVTVDLEAQTVVSPSGQTFRFEIDPVKKEKMLKGLDSIGETLQAAGDIDLYEMKRALDQPWLEDA
jgi:3-isopropylmalate dehydratase small subunit